MSNRPKSSIELENMLSHLKLDTVDATQTAFANDGIHISETTAFKWRGLAKENMISELPKLLYEDDENAGRNPIHEDTQADTGCCKLVAARLYNLVCVWK